MGPFESRYWGKITTAYLPQDIVKDGQLSLSTPAVMVLAALFDAQKGEAYVREKPWHPLPDHAYATARISREDITNRTGYSINPVIDGIRELKAAGWIEQSTNHEDERDKWGHFKPAWYTLMNVKRGYPLKECGRANPLLGVLRYFTFPRVLLRETQQRWCFAQMPASERRVYIALAYLANEARSNECKPPRAVVNKLTDMEGRTVAKALDGLEERGLLWLDSGAQCHSITFCDPYTGRPLEAPRDDPEDDLRNYREMRGRVARRASFNLSSAEIEKLIRSLVPPGDPVIRETNDVKIRCPYHMDDTPSCSISLSKGGIWHCFGCPESGNLQTLIQKLSGGTKIAAIQRIGRAAGVEVSYFRPDAEAIDIYHYRDKYGEVVKEVLRFPNKEDGSKDFQQRRRVPGGYVYNLNGMKSMLYNLDLLYSRVPDTVAIVEGEKDANTITNIGLRGRYGPVIGVTSGGAKTWDARLAKEFRAMRVIVMPDDDEAGRGYAEQVKASLEAEGIEHREISFTGTGANDVSDYLVDHAIDDLVELIGRDWVRMPGGELATGETPPESMCDLPEGEITL